jgi:hypothetical protein
LAAVCVCVGGEEEQAQKRTRKQPQRPEPKRGVYAAALPLAPARASDSPPRGCQFWRRRAGVPGEGFRFRRG